MGVSTKYLQKYMNWFRFKEMLKGSTNFIDEFTSQSLENITALKRFNAIPSNFEKLVSCQSLTNG